jgi:(S)-ureidoglycine aminohydrolase
MHSLGQTRSSHQRDHLLQTPDTFVRTTLPGLENGSAIVHIGPAAGAAFTQYTAEIEPGGTMTTTALQRFIYVVEGAADLVTDTGLLTLTPGGFAFLPAGSNHTVTARQRTVANVIEKPYEPLQRVAAPRAATGNESAIPSAALMGDDDLQVRNLLPADASYDFAVNTMTYQPGASLAQVEIHVMEHGLLMLEGGGIYKLGDCWYPVTAGDFIWMAPFCPQWFCAVGKRPAKYLIYKDTNRHPLG